MTLKVNELMKVDYLSGLDWDAQHADTRYMTHAFHAVCIEIYSTNSI